MTCWLSRAYTLPRPGERVSSPHANSCTRCVRCAPDPGDEEMDTEGDALSGVSRKHSMRSSSCWFTEFCKSQCLSHFAAPFIVVRAETSVAENCISKEGKGCTDRGLKHLNENGNRNEEHPVLLPSSPTIRISLSLSDSQKKVQGKQKRLCVNDPSAGSPTVLWGS